MKFESISYKQIKAVFKKGKGQGGRGGRGGRGGDSDSDGPSGEVKKIMDEIEDKLSTIKEDHLQKIFTNFDQDKNGFIEFDEFRTFLEAICDSKPEVRTHARKLF